MHKDVSMVTSQHSISLMPVMILFLTSIVFRPYPPNRWTHGCMQYTVVKNYSYVIDLCVSVYLIVILKTWTRIYSRLSQNTLILWQLTHAFSVHHNSFCVELSWSIRPIVSRSMSAGSTMSAHLHYSHVAVQPLNSSWKHAFYL